MDLFKPGNFSIHQINADGSLTEIDAASTDFLTNPQGESLSTCDYPPGVCLGDSDAAGETPSPQAYAGCSLQHLQHRQVEKI